MDRERLAAVFPTLLAKVVELVAVYADGCHDADLGRMQSRVREAMEKSFTSPPFASDVPGKSVLMEGWLRLVVPKIVTATHDPDRAVMLSKIKELEQPSPAVVARLVSAMQDA